jgi:8-oxo-dGTP pyrophosphatase MutT (NUDIX family)
MPGIPTITQISAGGVTFQKKDGKVFVALIYVGEPGRWQLPKGHVDEGETKEVTAVREVLEETGLHTEMVAPIDKIEYWFYVKNRGQRQRVHKFVYFYLLHFLSGDTEDHDFEVNEARWEEIDQAHAMLAFESEQEILRRAKEMILQFAG